MNLKTYSAPGAGTPEVGDSRPIADTITHPGELVSEIRLTLNYS